MAELGHRSKGSWARFRVNSWDTSCRQMFEDERSLNAEGPHDRVYWSWSFDLSPRGSVQGQSKGKHHAYDAATRAVRGVLIKKFPPETESYRYPVPRQLVK